MEALCCDWLSLHPSPPKGTGAHVERFEEESQENGCFSIASSRLGAAKVLFLQEDHPSLEETGGASLSPQMGCGWPGGSLPSSSSSSSLPEGCCGNIWEFKTNRAVPCLSMERIGPDEGLLQLAHVVSFNIIHKPQYVHTKGYVWALSAVCYLFKHF